jgi:hypothetical protein
MLGNEVSFYAQLLIAIMGNTNMYLSRVYMYIMDKILVLDLFLEHF